MKIALVDFDDTVFFTKYTVEEAARIILKRDLTKEEIRRLPKEVKGKIYEYAFKKLKHKSKPNNELIEFLKKLKKEGYKIIILTARKEDARADTEELLLKYGVLFDELHMRRSVSNSDEEWKLNMINKFLELDDVEDILVFDDKEDNIKFFKENINSSDKIKFYLVREDGMREV